MRLFCLRFHLALLGLVLLLALGLTACSQPARANPRPMSSPTWGTFYPTVVAFTTASAATFLTPTAVSTPQRVGEKAGSIF